MSHVAHMNESCRTYEWVMSHILQYWVMYESYYGSLLEVTLSHVAHINESCRTCWKSLVFKYAWHDSFICVTWLIAMHDMTHSYVGHGPCVLMWLIHMCDMTHSYMWHDSFIYVTWLIHMCAMTHSYVWHDSFICVTWLIHPLNTLVRVMSHMLEVTCIRICVTWLIYMCDMTHSPALHVGSCDDEVKSRKERPKRKSTHPLERESKRASERVCVCGIKREWER